MFMSTKFTFHKERSFTTNSFIFFEIFIFRENLFKNAGLM